MKTLIALTTFTLAFVQAESAIAAGPGTEMTRIINRAGLGSDCSHCRALANQMDAGGSGWVMGNFDQVTRRTIANAERLGHRMGPVRRAGVRTMVRTAVRRASY